MKYVFGIVIVLVVICVLYVLLSKNKNKGLDSKSAKDWSKVAEDKWNKIQTDIAVIDEIHKKTWTDNKKIGWPEKKTLDATKRRLASSKAAYDGYIAFCNLKNVSIPEERYEYELVIAEAEDALEDPKHALDNSLGRASNTYDEVYSSVNEIGEKLFQTRVDTVEVIGNVEDFINSISKCPKEFQKDFKEVAVYKEQFKETVDFAIEQKKVLEKSAASVGAGVAAGGAVAAMAPSAALWVATTFGTASTGTAISALSGAAATNAALAWLGGGALAAGGGGMAAGNALLALAGPIGWGIAGTSILASVLFAWRKKLKVEENKKNEIIRMKNCTFSLRKVKARMESILVQTKGIAVNLENQKEQLIKLEGKDYTKFSDEQKQKLGALVNNTKALAALLCEVIE